MENLKEGPGLAKEKETGVQRKKDKITVDLPKTEATLTLRKKR